MRTIVSIFLSVVFITSSLHAQNVRKIDLQEAIKLALKNNYAIKQAENDLDLAETRVKSAKADFLPSVNANASSFRQIGQQFNNSTLQFKNFTMNGMRSNVNADIPLFTGWQNINNLKSSTYNAESQQDAYNRARENVIFQTASRYLQVLLSQELLEIAKQNLDASQQQLEQVKAQVEVGSRPTADQYNQEATVASNELDVTNQENQLQFDRLRLIRQLQIDPMKEYELVKPNIDESDVNPKNYNLQDLVKTALENRSDLASAQMNIKSIEKQVDVARGALLPQLSFGASLSSSYNDQYRLPSMGSNGQPSYSSVGFSDQFFDQNINKGFSLSLSIPLFNNFNRKLNIESQQIQYKNARLQLENTQLEVVQEVRQAYNDYISYTKQLESTRKALQASRKAYETQQERYKVGASTLIELSQANANFVKAQSDRVRSIYNFIFQEKLIDYYLGNLGPEISFKAFQN